MAALQRFVCAEPPKYEFSPYRGKHHPEPWALDVQSWLRGLALPSKATTEGVILGVDDGEVVSASHFGFDRSGEQFIIFAIGTAIARQRRGLATDAMAMTRIVLHENRVRLEMDCGVFTRIHRKNTTIKTLFSRAGFMLLGAEGDYENWVGTTG